MRIKSLHISHYKNLKDFKIQFDGSSCLDIMVGKNGTGKSNLLEALIEIFRHLFEKEYFIAFDYEIQYTIKDESVQVKWEKGHFWNQEENQIRKPSANSLPDNVLIYYSGHNESIEQLLKANELGYKTKLNANRNSSRSSADHSRDFIGIDKAYKTILIAVALVQREESKLKRFVKDKLGIHVIGDEICFTLKRPDYAKGTEYDFDEIDEKQRFWAAEGFVSVFLNRIYGLARKTSPPIREEGLIEDRYLMYRDLNAFQTEFSNLSPFELYQQIDFVKAIGMLEDVSLNLTLEDGTILGLSDFSDGQFQTVYIYAITELFKDRNCITLLDEPDSFLHPEWQHEFLSQIFELSKDSAESNHILMTSHSAVTLIPQPKEKVKIFEVRDSVVFNFEAPKHIAIKRLSMDVIKYCEHDRTLSIINTVQIENKPVLFTEGYTDPLIVKEAWKKLFGEEEIPFIPFFAFGHSYIANLLRDDSIHKEMRELPIFGLLDFDQAYENFGSFSEVFEVDDPYHGLAKKHRSLNSYLMMLPVPQESAIKAQVINPDTQKNYGNKSLMTIEHLFYHAPGASGKFTKDKTRPGNLLKFSGDKVKFAKEFIPTLSSDYFQVFKPMFEFIKSKI